jgi:hypothetical protein
MKRIATIVVAVIACVVTSARHADACTCLPSGPACGDYWKSAAVFLARVEAVTPPASKGIARLSRRAQLTVLEAFSGVSPGVVEVTTAGSGASCGFNFVAGRQYVVYAQRVGDSGQLTVSSCSRTREVSQAGDDLAYARALTSGAAPPARITGDVLIGVRTLSRQTQLQPRPMPGVTVRFTRDGDVRTATTDADGRFVVEGVAPGPYGASLDLPAGYYGEIVPNQVTVPDHRGCAEVHAVAYEDGRVLGRLVDSAGRPVAGLTIDLTVAAGLDQMPGAERIRDLTDSEGRYELVRVPPGRFIVGINTRRDRDDVMAEPRVFHPGVSDLSTATRVVVGGGKRVELKDFTLPSSVAYVAVSGIVIGSDGSPATGARVYLKGADAEFIVSEPAITDASGRFVLAALAGRSYRLFAERERQDGSDRRIDSSGQSAFTAVNDLHPFRLVLVRRY